MSDFVDQDQSGPVDEPLYPSTVKAAGIIWIVFGCIILVNVALSFLLAASFTAAGEQALASAQSCLGFVQVVFAVAFLYVGVQSVRGTAPGTLGNGIGSLIFGVLNIGPGLLATLAGLRNPVLLIPGVIGLLCGVALLVAGVLALVGTADYKAWREVHKPRKAGNRGPRA
jgi:hypothetical protein